MLLTLIGLIFLYQDDIRQSSRLEPPPDLVQLVPHPQVPRTFQPAPFPLLPRRQLILQMSYTRTQHAHPQGCSRR